MNNITLPDQPEELFHLGVKALIRNSEGKILVLEANPKNSHWELPGGRMQKSSDLETTLRRELEEEIGLNSVKIIELFDCSISKHRVHLGATSISLVIFTFLCEISPDQEIRLMDDEHISFQWVSPLKASELLSNKFSDQLTEKIKQL